MAKVVSPAERSPHLRLMQNITEKLSCPSGKASGRDSLEKTEVTSSPPIVTAHGYARFAFCLRQRSIYAFISSSGMDPKSID